MNPFKNLTKKEWLLYSISLAVVAVSNILTGDIDPVNLAATLIGVTALIFIAKGDVWGQILTVFFAILYSITSCRFHYWGEMITYMGMTAPIAAMSVISWLRHPYEKGKNVVKIHKMSGKQIALMMALAISVTVLFYFVLKYFETPNLIISTVSITTSFLASYLMLFRNSYYALAYAANDVVLITLWVLATLTDIAYLPMILCFTMFFINDLYGFISWKKREKEQGIDNKQ
ncbi:MAG: nicotinamide mononucleotide transporter [Clostridia bacterium]|nr:nicotinamide mononucleotide transporter [Clostridia bacterium]